MATTEYEDVTLRLPKGLKELALADPDAGGMTLSEIVADALAGWIQT